MLIREANLTDAAAIAKVHVDTWRTTYNKLMPAEFLANLSYEQREKRWVEIFSNRDQDNFTYVVENEIGEIVGFANGGRERTGDPLYHGELYAIYILEKYQRQGLGYRLLSSIVARLVQLGINSMLVWVAANNSACRFYQSLGGQLVHQKQEKVGTVDLMEFAYAWTDIRGCFKSQNVY